MSSDASDRVAARVAADDPSLVGLAVYGSRNAVDKVFKRLPLPT